MSADASIVLGRALQERAAGLVDALVDRHYALNPELATRYGEAGRQHCIKDAHYHVAIMAQALLWQRPEFFSDYIAWAKVMLLRRGVPVADLAAQLSLLRTLLSEQFGARAADAAARMLDECIADLPSMPEGTGSFLDAAAPLAGLARDYLDLLLRGDRAQACARVLAAAQAGASLRDIYLEVIQRCQRETGRLWQLNEISVAQEHYISAVTQLVMSQLAPRVTAGEQRRGRLVATCVAGDLHEVGLRIVCDLLEQDGWDVCYLGASTPAPSVVGMLVEREAQMLVISASLTLHVAAVESLVALTRGDARCGQVRILAGGYPFNLAPELWKQVGADGCASDAAEAVALTRRLFAASA